MSPDLTPRRIAMWSGPRNISTALMRSWGNRTDTFVCDEPFYAHYLEVTGVDHPGRDEVIANQETDWQRTVTYLTGDVPSGKRIFYQKHMAHHLLPDMDRSWIAQMTNAFLIRDPGEMLTSLIKVTSQPTIADTGLQLQCELFEVLRRETGEVPLVLDSRDILENPRDMLTLACERLDVPFSEEMLSWPPGPRKTDGVWARHWYAAVEKSTGFQPYTSKPDRVPDRLSHVCSGCMDFYQMLYKHRLTV